MSKFFFWMTMILYTAVMFVPALTARKAEAYPIIIIGLLLAIYFKMDEEKND